MGNDNNADAYRASLLFEEYLNQIYDSFTGASTQLVQDSNDPSKFYLDRKEAVNESIGNAEGGRFLVGEMRKAVFNKHTAMGDLTQDEIADITCNVSCVTIDAMMFYSNKYGIKDLALLEAFGLNMDMGMYTFLTALRKGKLREFGEKILTIQVVTRPQEQAQQPKGIIP